MEHSLWIVDHSSWIIVHSKLGLKPNVSTLLNAVAGRISRSGLYAMDHGLWTMDFLPTANRRLALPRKYLVQQPCHPYPGFNQLPVYNIYMGKIVLIIEGVTWFYFSV